MNHRQSVVLPLLLALFLPSAVCRALEDGYQRYFVDYGVPMAGAIAVAGPYALYFSHDSEPDYLPEKIYRFDPISRESTLAADGLGSIAAMVYDADHDALFVADNGMGTLGFGDTLLVLRDGNGDGDFLDEGEIMAYAPSGSLPFISGLDRAPDGRIFAANADSSQGDVYAIEDSNGDGDALDAGEVSLFCTGAQSLYLAGVAVHVNVSGPQPVTEVYYNDASGEVFRLIDANGDGDADDPGERFLFASGLGGGYDLIFDAEGDCFVTAGTLIWRLPPGGVAAGGRRDNFLLFDDLSADAGFLMGLELNLPTIPFEPWFVPGAQLQVAHLDPMYANPAGLFVIEAQRRPTGTPEPTMTPPPLTSTPTASETSGPTHTATPTPAGTGTAAATDTPPPSATATPTTPPATPSPPATGTPSPTVTGTAPPTATPQARLGVMLRMPAVRFHPGDPCWLTAEVCNPGPDAGSVPLAVLLDIGTGDYWFWPSWAHYPPAFDIGAVFLSQGCQQIAILSEFAWPPNGGGANGLRFLAALLTADLTAIAGDTGVWEFGYSED